MRDGVVYERFTLKRGGDLFIDTSHIVAIEDAKGGGTCISTHSNDYFEIQGTASEAMAQLGLTNRLIDTR